MFEMNLICRCDHVPCGAERVVRVRVTLSKKVGVSAYVSQIAPDHNELHAILDSHGRHVSVHDRVLCPTHKSASKDTPR